jgi:hypothetical protein
MCKISFDDFVKMILFDVAKRNACIEIEFSIDGDMTYCGCWLGKTIDRKTNKSFYWYGLVEDGSQAFEYDNIDDSLNAQVFGGMSIKQLWSRVTLFSIDACDVKERLAVYLGLANGPMMGPAQSI